MDENARDALGLPNEKGGDEHGTDDHAEAAFG
jgi:hypothetical protein